METNYKIKPFDESTNKQLRELYLRSISTPISYDEGKTFRPRARHSHVWEAIQRQLNPIDITQHVKDVFQDIWIWSDLHFGHKNIIRFSDRPFETTEQMDEILVKNFNELVKPNDISIWVGDVSFKQETESRKLIRRLNGYKILIIGNHDIYKKQRVMNLAFDEYHVVYNLSVNDTVLALTHYPMDNLPDGWFNVHGHVHRNGHHADEVSMPTHLNVNCEFLNYKPINMATLIQRIERTKTNPREKKFEVRLEDGTLLEAFFSKQEAITFAMEHNSTNQPEFQDAVVHEKQ